MVKHMSQRALALVWLGVNVGFEIPIGMEVPAASRACDARYEGEAIVFEADILKEIPSCPQCAVLHDEAMTAREELLGRKEAA